jgi:glycosyltransferase involved in cell wall biosynthesis
MKVIFIPAYSNPYQKALANWLSKEGADVSFGISSYLFSVLGSVKNNWKPDVLHIHWLHPFLLASSRGKTILKSVSFIGELIILKLFGIKIVWTVHNIISHETKFKSLELFFTKLLSRLCNRIIVHSSSAKNEVIETYRIRDSSIIVIPHGNYIDCYENVIDKAKAKKQLHLSSEDVIFLYFGQIRPYKGVLELVDAFKRLEQSQAKLLIIGKPLNNEVANDVVKKCTEDERIRTVLKFIPDDELQIYMNAADIIVQPYKNILTSGAVILAMSFGKPVIAPSIGCIRDVLDDEGSFLYAPSDEEGLLKAMKCALDANLKKMGEHNSELAKQLRWDDIAKRSYEVYEKCLNLKRKR